MNPRLALSRILPAGNTALLLFASAVPAAAAHAQTTPNWGNPVWQDEFGGAAGAAPDPSKWTFDLGNNFGNGEIDTGTNSRANSYQDGNGNLVLKAIYDPTTKTYTSAHLKTAGLYNAGPYGRIETRIQNPFASGVGAAFWGLGSAYATGTPWPWSGELDIMEITATTPGHNGSTIHGGETDGGHIYDYGGISRTVDLPSGQYFYQGFHTFGVNWAPYHLTFDLDGVQYGETYLHNTGITDIWALNLPFYLILSMGVGASNSGTVDPSTYPATLLADYVRVYKTAAPAAPGGLTATNTTTNATTLNWSASSTADAKYDIYVSANPNFTPGLDSLVAENVTGTTYTQTGLAASTTNYYKVVAADFGGESAPATTTVTTQAQGNSSGVKLSAGGYAVGNFMQSKYVLGGSTNYHPGLVVDTSAVTNPPPPEVYQVERFGAAAWTITDLNPGQVYKVRIHMAETAHNGAGQRAFNIVINSQTVLPNFDIYQAAGAQNRAIVEEFYTEANEYGIVEVAVTNGSVSGDTNPSLNALEIVPATGGSPLVGAAPGTTKTVSINSGAGGAAGNFIADTDFIAGAQAPAVTNTIDTSAANAAPQAIYQTQHYVPFTYVLNGLQAGATYDVRMHFAETYPGDYKNGARVFNVNVNGSPALQNFDVYAHVGSNKALVKDTPTKADMYGQIIVQFLYGGADQPFIDGIEAIQTAAASTAPAKPVVSLVQQSSSFYLQWGADPTPGVTYSVTRQVGTGAATTLATGLTLNSYTDSASLVNGTSYTYTVTATSPSGQTATSDPKTQTYSGPAVGGVTQINAGGGAAGSYVADKGFSGGGTNATGNPITLPAGDTTPLAVYQSERAGVFTYTVPGFTPGSSHIVRLHFAEYYFQNAGQRVFNISINGQLVLPNFDIVSAAGGANKAVIESFTVPATGGQYVISFTSGSANQPKLSGLEVQ